MAQNDRPWIQYQANADGNPFEKLLSKIPNCPELVFCVLFRSMLAYRDRVFIAAFIFQNRPWFNELDIKHVVSRFNRNYSEDRWAQVEGVVQWFRDAEFEGQHNEDALLRLCSYYSFDLFAQRVLDLRGHIRHFNVAYPFWGDIDDDRDVCAPYIAAYNNYNYVRFEELCSRVPVCTVSDEPVIVSVNSTAVLNSVAEVDPEEEIPDRLIIDEDIEDTLIWLAENIHQFTESTVNAVTSFASRSEE